MPEDIVKPAKQSSEATSAPPLEASENPDGLNVDSGPKKIEINTVSEKVDDPSQVEPQIDIAEEQSAQEPEGVAQETPEEVPVSEQETASEPEVNASDSPEPSLEAELTETPQDSPTEPHDEAKDSESAPEATPKNDEHNTHSPEDAPEPHQTKHAPIAAILIAVVVCLSLVGVVIYMTLVDKSEDTTPTQSQVTTETQVKIDNPTDKADIDSAITEASQLPAVDDPTTGITDQSIGL